MIMLVPSVSEHRAVGGLAQEQMPWCGGGNPEGFELSAFDMQNQKPRAKLPFKCFLQSVHLQM